MEGLQASISRQINKRRRDDVDTTLGRNAKRARQATDLNSEIVNLPSSSRVTIHTPRILSLSEATESSEGSAFSSDTLQSDRETKPSSEVTESDSSDNSSDSSSDRSSCDESESDSNVSSSLSAKFAKHSSLYYATLPNGAKIMPTRLSSSSDTSSESSSDRTNSSDSASSDDSKSKSDSGSESESERNSESASESPSESPDGSTSESGSDDVESDSSTSSSSARSSSSEETPTQLRTTKALTSSNLAKLQSRLESLLPKLQAGNEILEHERREGKLEDRNMEIVASASDNEEDQDLKGEAREPYIEMNLDLGVLEEVKKDEMTDIVVKKETVHEDGPSEDVLPKNRNKKGEQKGKKPLIEAVAE